MNGDEQGFSLNLLKYIIISIYVLGIYASVNTKGGITRKYKMTCLQLDLLMYLFFN